MWWLIGHVVNSIWLPTPNKKKKKWLGKLNQIQPGPGFDQDEARNG